MARQQGRTVAYHFVSSLKFTGNLLLFATDSNFFAHSTNIVSYKMAFDIGV